MRLSVIAFGDIHAEQLEPLTHHCTHIEQLVLDVPPRNPVAQHRAEFNRAVDASTDDWMLILREREEINAALAKEIADAVAASKAWGFRIRSIPYYAGAPLQLGTSDGEVRLFHKRHYLRFANKGEWEELMIQGTVIRLSGALRSVTFDSSDAHRAYLEQHAVRRSSLRRALTFLGYAISAKTADRNTLRYLWIEAGWQPS